MPMTSIIVCMTMLGRAAAVPQHCSPSLTPFAAAHRMCAGLLGARQLLSMTFSVCMELRQNPAVCPNVQTRQPWPDKTSAEGTLVAAALWAGLILADAALMLCFTCSSTFSAGGFRNWKQGYAMREGTGAEITFCFLRILLRINQTPIFGTVIRGSPILCYY